MAPARTGAPPIGAADPARDPHVDAASLDAVVAAVYVELCAVAHRHLAARGGASGGGTLVTGALVHEAYLKLASAEQPAWRDRSHFLAIAAVAMRQILVDRARARAALKRGGTQARVTLDEDALAVDDDPVALLEIDEALDQLAAVSPRLARVVELRFYGGLSEEEIALALGLTVRTVQRDWSKARMLLRRALAP